MILRVEPKAKPKEYEGHSLSLHIVGLVATEPSSTSHDMCSQALPYLLISPKEVEWPKSWVQSQCHLEVWAQNHLMFNISLSL